MLKYLIGMFFISCISFSAIASDNTSNKKMLYKGDFEVGGNMSLSSTSNASNSTYFTVFSKLQYFVIDNLSIGGSVSYYHYSASFRDSYGIGPSVSYYFWTKEKLAAYVSQSLFLEKYKNDSTSLTNKSGTSILGVNYFVTPSVALGLSLNFYYILDTVSDYRTRSLRVAFTKYF